ncbi:MAG: hypothetical protein ACRDS9_09310 [Pseudonocardiaceae bacterium]
MSTDREQGPRRWHGPARPVRLARTWGSCRGQVVDLVVVERWLAGHEVETTPEERIAAMYAGEAAGLPRNEICRRLGEHASRLAKILATPSPIDTTRFRGLYADAFAGLADSVSDEPTEPRDATDLEARSRPGVLGEPREVGGTE